MAIKYQGTEVINGIRCKIITSSPKKKQVEIKAEKEDKDNDETK